MHSERDIHVNQTYQTVLSENSRLAKAKTDKVVETGGSTQIYINIFSGKKRLACFDDIVEENDVVPQEVQSNTSDKKHFGDFNDIPIKLVHKKSTKKQKTKLQTMVKPEAKQTNFKQ